MCENSSHVAVYKDIGSYTHLFLSPCQHTINKSSTEIVICTRGVPPVLFIMFGVPFMMDSELVTFGMFHNTLVTYVLHNTLVTYVHNIHEYCLPFVSCPVAYVYITNAYLHMCVDIFVAEACRQICWFYVLQLMMIINVMFRLSFITCESTRNSGFSVLCIDG